MSEPIRTAHGNGPESMKPEGGVVKRRGLLAFAAALVGAAVARMAKPEPVEAGHDGTNIFHLGATNAAAASTALAATGGGGNAALGVSNTSGRGLNVTSSSGWFGIRVQSTDASAVSASATSGPGVLASSSTNDGVQGSSSSGDGVVGFSTTGIGVFGQSLSNSAMRGEISGSSTANVIAIYGVNNSSFAGPGPGAGGFGVYGLSAKGHGLVGATAAAGGAAVVGATNGVAGAWAAAFYGPVIIGGDLLVVGGAKSAAVPFPDGTNRQLYCVESPESWFEDFGTGMLVNGKAEIAIEAGFGAVAEVENYHVFLTAYDSDHLLHVTKRTSKGFTVEANAALAALQGQNKVDLTGTFSWRVVAKRKDIVGERLAKVSMPPEPVLPPVQDRTMTRRNIEGPDDVMN
jgi:hypothetical protein